MIDWFLALMIVVPAGMLFLSRSFWLLDYLIFLSVFNRGIRRYVDWLQGEFNPFSPISLTPLVVSGLIFLMVMQNCKQLPPSVFRVLQFFGVAIGLAFGIGFLSNGLASVYALAEYIAPVSVIGFAAMAGGDERLLDRWVKSVGWAATLACAYGWYQYYTIPVWDAFWVRAVGFEGYLGNLKPTEMVVFSTMAERGPFAGFISFAVIPMILSKRWRNQLSWFAVALIFATILLTFVRTAIITVALAALVYPLLNRGKNTLQIMLALGLVAVGLPFFMSSLPSSEKIDERLDTLQSITEDGSFTGRIDIAAYGLRAVLGNPIGTGLGSTGLAGRVNTGGLDSQAVIGDNGYLEILLTFGWIGSLCFFYALYLIWQNLRTLEKSGYRSDAIMMSKAFMVTGAVVLMVGNWLVGPGAMIFCIFVGFAMVPGNTMNELKRILTVLAILEAQDEITQSSPTTS